MLDDLNFSEKGNEIFLAVGQGGSLVRHAVTEKLALKLLRQLADILGRRAEKNDPAPSEAASHVVDPPSPSILRSESTKDERLRRTGEHEEKPDKRDKMWGKPANLPVCENCNKGAIVDGVCMNCGHGEPIVHGGA